MKILGINDGHNAAACLLEDGRVTAALQEERLRRIKNWSGMPTQAIETILAMRGVSAADLDWVALNGSHVAYPQSRDQLMQEYRTINDVGVTLRRSARRLTRTALRATPLFERMRGRSRAERYAPLLAMGVKSGRIVCVDHHTAHAASAYYGLGRFDGEVLVLTCDGSGDGLCATVNIGRNGKIERLHAVAQEHSVGNIYAMVTFIMGMVPLEHEYKLMGLSPYAEPGGAEKVYDELRRLMRFDGNGSLGWSRDADCPETYCSYRFFTRLFEGKRFDWIAGGLQKFTETFLTEWVRRCIEQTGIRRVALGGGIFMNVKANKSIMELPEVDELFVYPSCGDETNAMGAAYWAHAQNAGVADVKPLADLYWGPRYTDADVEQCLKEFAFPSAVRYERYDDIERRVAELLAGGTIVARFKGREEFGARALGNRSIIANPSNPTSVRVLNEAIKSRDFWMPFAASMIAERSSEYIVNPKRVPAPYMILTFDTTARRQEIQAAIHPFDFTVRPQEVSAALNPDYHRLLGEFERLTGIGAVLNTSFNLHGFPIVSRPRDALDVLDRSGLTHLAIENWLVWKDAER